MLAYGPVGVTIEANSIAREYGIDFTTATEVGQTVAVVIRYAEERDVGHSIHGSHGRRVLARFLLGSVAERVARRGPGSVTIIREHQPERETEASLHTQ